ncbi:MAG: hypothetical protein KAU62_00020 [Candidatus Heimdallarchaeota archaeon]|nr:hypothetical protein [Candidatus Heimdallarchaeota archaeon]MCG3254430.1 hypothetical protein [Candidatus Heimdallarchaeota archaeon]MCK4609515.1 hypothetical protein [Candidatus Heimdallarchaeota archaeon]
MVAPDNIRNNRVFEKSIPLIHKCLRDRVSITLLLSTLKLIERGYIKGEKDLDSFMEKRKELNPKYIEDAEKVKELILESYF